MQGKEIVDYCIESLLNKGADRVQCVLSKSKKHEINVATNKITLLRTTFDTSLRLVAIKDHRKGSISINKTDKDSIDNAVSDVLAIAEASQQDPAHDISPKQPAKEFNSGLQEADLNKMYDRLKGFLEEVNRKYPKTILEQSVLDFTHVNSFIKNSNGVDFTSSKGTYYFMAMFTSKDGDKSSSFNYSGFAARDIEDDLINRGSLGIILRQSGEQTSTTPVRGKFTGDILVTPDCLESFINFLVDVTLRDGSIISGTSIFKNKLNQKVVDSKFTLHSRPVSDEIADGYFITPDGFEAQNSTIIDRGVLKTFLLSLYGANKTGLQRAVNSGGAYVVEPGEKSFEDMVKSIKRGIMVCRFSGGHPGENGDFSGVAKNSYYIEDGQIRYPVSETMISGNLEEMFNNIKDISRERINFGNAVFPWITFSGITISGK